MFFISNRFSFYGTIVLLVVVAGVTNIRVNAVRAEGDAIGQQSILYALITQDQTEIIEEYVYPEENMQYSAYTSSEGVGTLAVNSNEGHFPNTYTQENTGILAVNTGVEIASLQNENTVQASFPRKETLVYAVESGDTLSGIAKKFDLSINTLLWANNLSLRSVLRPGQEIAILPINGVVHTVKSGDTLSGIAKKYAVDVSAITGFNNTSSTASLKIGQQFIVPGGIVSATTTRVTTSSVAVKDIFTSAPTGSGGTKTPGSGVSMIWPTDLSYIVRGLSWYHTGYDIDCNGHANGTSTNDNYAAADGVVQFAGVKRGYGNMVEIDHGNGLLTRYGHFYSLYVKTGETVSMGDALGRCGSTGDSTGTHLHFEVVDVASRKYLNPANYIRR